MKYKSYKQIIVLAALMCCSVLVWGLTKAYKTRSEVKQQKPLLKTDEIVYDPALLHKLERLKKMCEQMKSTCTMVGKMTVTDKTDSTANMDHVDFAYCLTGNNLYYKLGTTETINSEGVYLVIDHTAKRVTLSAQKKITGNSPVSVTSTEKTLRSENYELKGSTSGNMESITMLNEHHITCKQYTLTYDTVAHTITQIFARYTNFNYPANKDKERVTTIQLTKYTNEANLNSFKKPEQVIDREGDGWKLQAAYKDYQLIVL